MLQKAMISEIDIEIITLNQAMRDHFAWSNKLIEISLFNDNADDTYTGAYSHQHCAFGYWLRSQVSSFDEDSSELSAIEATHEIMHDAMRELISSIQDQTIKREKLNNYFHAQIHFLQTADVYKTSLISMRNCYDTLTGLPLRQLLYKDFSRVSGTKKPRHSTLYLTLIDIDYFKSVNDTWGHNVGDIILKELGHLLSSNVRSIDRMYRFGGEEFIILQQCNSYHDFTSSITRLMALIRMHAFIIPSGTVNITVTSGTTIVKQSSDLQKIIDEADQAMYFGKQNGRNQCIFWSDLKMVNIENALALKKPNLV